MSKDKKQIRHKAGAYTFYLKRILPGVMLMALNQDDKPRVPTVEVTYAGGVKGSELNPNDKEFLQKMENWEAMYASRLFRVCVTFGIDRVTNAAGEEANPSPEEIEKIRFLYGDQTPAGIVRLYWLAEVLGNTSNGFMNLCMGQTEVTEAGMTAAEDKFRPDDTGTRPDGENYGLSAAEPVADVVPE